MVSSYTANLAAFLTIESLSTPISNVEELANADGAIPYGAKRGGSTFGFFKEVRPERSVCRLSDRSQIFPFHSFIVYVSRLFQSENPIYQKMYEFMNR